MDFQSLPCIVSRIRPAVHPDECIYEFSCGMCVGASLCEKCLILLESVRQKMRAMFSFCTLLSGVRAIEMAESPGELTYKIKFIS